MPHNIEHLRKTNFLERDMREKINFSLGLNRNPIIEEFSILKIQKDYPSEKFNYKLGKIISSLEDREQTPPFLRVYLDTIGVSLGDLDGLRVAESMLKSGVWNYFKEREESSLETGDWILGVGRQRAQELYQEGGEMWRLASEVFGVRNMGVLHGSVWAKFDTANWGVDQDRAKGILSQHRDIIVSILKSRASSIKSRATSDEADILTPRLVIETLNACSDINGVRGVAIAGNKQRYLEAIASGRSDDLDLALEDWPEEYKSVISNDEARIYWQDAYFYLKYFPDGLLRYAQWSMSQAVQDSRVFDAPAVAKDELDFRIVLASQQDDTRDSFIKACKLTDVETAKSYLKRVVPGINLNFHDALIWTQWADKITTEELKSILASIADWYGNQDFLRRLPSYDKTRDFFSDKPITSLRELIKRVSAIEANVDISSLPQEIAGILDAPGLNLAALERFSYQPRFRELFEGKLDHDQPFQPNKRTFTLRPLAELVSEGLGSTEQGIKGTASSSRKLYSALKRLIEGQTIDGKKMEVDDLLNFVPEDLTQDVLDILRKFKVDTGPIVSAQIHAKSDPEGWVCGDYTDSCMPFGDPKNDDYMFNPSTQYFTIKYNGRIVAQSVVVDSSDTRTGEHVVILDNIEVANNYLSLHPLIARAYELFWSDYTDKPVKIGISHSDLEVPSTQTEENFYRPKTPLYYSDARGSTILNLPKLRDRNELRDQSVTIENLTSSEQGIDLVTQMEMQAYPEDLVQGTDFIEDVLRRQEVISPEFSDVNFLLKVAGEAAGYVLSLPEESEINKGETVLHIYDFAVAPEYRNRGIAIRMMKHLLELASAHKLPIEAEVRRNTIGEFLSSEIVRERLLAMGFRVSKHKNLPDYLGNEDFSYIRIQKLPEEVQVETAPLEALTV